jgi:hypothetical protein
VIEMTIVSNRTRRPSHSATTHGSCRRRGVATGSELPLRATEAPVVEAAAKGKVSSIPGASSTREPEPPLDDVVLTTWAALLAGHPVECPVCGGPLTAAQGCSGCGARLT